MGFFENLGRKVEEFKQTAAETAAEQATHVCRSCGERFYSEHDECPACGAGAVVPRTADPDGGADGSARSADNADDGGADDGNADDGGADGGSEGAGNADESERREPSQGS